MKMSCDYNPDQGKRESRAEQAAERSAYRTRPHVMQSRHVIRRPRQLPVRHKDAAARRSLLLSRSDSLLYTILLLAHYSDLQTADRA